jgi:hypothetical protein
MPELKIQFSRAAPVAFFDRWILDRAKLICRLSHSPFSHGDIVLSGDHLLGASDNIDAPIIASHPQGNARGVAIRPCNYQPFSMRRTAHIPCTREQHTKFIRFAYDQLGKPFDHSALAFKTFLSADFADRNWRDPSMWYCHELIARCFEMSGLITWKLINIKNRVTSSDLLIMISPLVSNPDTFWDLVPGTIMTRGEM